jgi:hypothetical protein
MTFENLCQVTEMQTKQGQRLEKLRALLKDAKAGSRRSSSSSSSASSSSSSSSTSADKTVVSCPKCGQTLRVLILKSSLYRGFVK